MARLTLLALIIMVALSIHGCGGGGSGSSSAYVIRIQSQRFYPKTITIKSGDGVQWINSDTQSHVVASGTLEKVSNPEVLSEIAIQADNTFSPSEVEANFGDTVQWRNDTGFDFTMDILNDAGVVVETLEFTNGEVIGYSDFPAAGLYTTQQHGNVFFSGTIILYGVPNPDGVFQTPTLPNGGTFSRTFTGSGTVPYYVLDLDDPNKSFITGSLTIQ
ncbi:MAG: hypothetical protein ABFD49_04300 [Armatimonadota bacterium]|nr:hypothetical protein [bacterium]